MLSLLRRRAFSTCSIRRQHWQELERDGQRMLRVVERRIAERSRIQSQLTEDLASPDDIPRLRHLKDTESLQSAWDEWNTNTKV